MIIASKYLRSCSEQNEADLFHVGFSRLVVNKNRYHLNPIQILGFYSSLPKFYHFSSF